MTATPDRSELRRRATEAGADRWYALIDNYEMGTLFLTREGDLNDQQTAIAQIVPDRVGRYIAAAHPQAVLALLDALDRRDARIVRLTALVEAMGRQYVVNGRHEWHVRDCVYRKTWPIGGQDEPWCVAARAALGGSDDA